MCIRPFPVRRLEEQTHLGKAKSTRLEEPNDWYITNFPRITVYLFSQNKRQNAKNGTLHSNQIFKRPLKYRILYSRPFIVTTPGNLFGNIPHRLYSTLLCWCFWIHMDTDFPWPLSSSWPLNIILVQILNTRKLPYFMLLQYCSIAFPSIYKLLSLNRSFVVLCPHDHFKKVYVPLNTILWQKIIYNVSKQFVLILHQTSVKYCSNKIYQSIELFVGIVSLYEIVLVNIDNSESPICQPFKVNKICLMS